MLSHYLISTKSRNSKFKLFENPNSINYKVLAVETHDYEIVYGFIQFQKVIIFLRCF